jgi:hypothetical protein
MNKTGENSEDTAEPLLANCQQARLRSCSINLLQITVPYFHPLLVLHMARNTDAQFA